MLTISEFSKKIYFIKSDSEVNEKELLQNGKVKRLIGGGNYVLKLGDHDIWILRISVTDRAEKGWKRKSD